MFHVDFVGYALESLIDAAMAGAYPCLCSTYNHHQCDACRLKGYINLRVRLLQECEMLFKPA